MTDSQIDNLFKYHGPVGDQVLRYAEIRDGFRNIARLVNRLCPESREKSLAITQLQIGMMCANASIAVNEIEKPPPTSGSAG